MGRITEGPMGNIRGKVGNLVVTKWRKTTTVKGRRAPSDKPSRVNWNNRPDWQ